MPIMHSFCRCSSGRIRRKTRRARVENWSGLGAAAAATADAAAKWVSLLRAAYGTLGVIYPR